MACGCLFEKLRRENHRFSYKKGKKIKTLCSQEPLPSYFIANLVGDSKLKKKQLPVSKQKDWLKLSVNVKRSRIDSLLMKQAWRESANRWGERWQVRKTARASSEIMLF